MSTEENKALVLRFLERVWNEHDLGAIEETLSPNYTVHDASGGSQPSGPAAYRQGADRFLTALPDLQTTIEQAVAEGDLVAVRGTDRATHRGELMGFPPTGKALTITWMGIYRVEGGKIAEEWLNPDNLSLMQQLGATI